MKLPRVVWPWQQNPQPTRMDPALSLDEWALMVTGGLGYPFMPLQTLQGDREQISQDFQGYIQGALKNNGVVFACELTRLMHFAEARFQFRRLQNGRPGDLFGTQDLAILEQPWPNGTTGDLLARAIMDADLAGNFFVVRLNGQLKRLRPDWVTIVMGSRNRPPSGRELAVGDLDAEVIGYSYQPGGPGSGADPVALGVDLVAHFAPIPDPLAMYRGMSWVTPVLREIMGDSAATTHKLKFFENGATVNMVVSLDPSITVEAFEKWQEKFERQHRGVLNAYRTLFIGGGADVKTVGSTMEQMTFKEVQGAGETRIAAAAGVPPAIVGLSEGLQGSSLNAGNFGAARRRFADGTMRPLWRNLASSMSRIITIPAGAELWYDDRDISFLREDKKDAAEIAQLEAQSIRTLVDAGYKPETVIAAITNNYDWSRLVHTGWYSVQMQPPAALPAAAPQPSNGTPPNGQPAPAAAT
jgi:Phage portal protein